VCQQCTPGSFRGPGEASCIACPFPAYSALPGAVACTGCAEGYYLVGFQPAGHARCHRCAMPYTTTATASVGNARGRYVFADACRCMAGYHGCSWSCRPCPPGTYKEGTSYTPDSGPCDQAADNEAVTAAATTNGAGADSVGWGQDPADRCIPCGAGLFSSAAAVTAASACLPCPTPTAPNPSHSGCECPLGSYLNATAALIGKASGRLLCPLCSPGTYGVVVGLTAASECIACAANGFSPAGSTRPAECECNSGYAGVGATECEPCPSDYRSVPGGLPGTGAAARCMQCPANSVSPQASGRCQCVSRTYPAWGPAAEWNLLAGPTLWCLQCPSNSFSALDR
jgi:hypothetical protein